MKLVLSCGKSSIFLKRFRKINLVGENGWEVVSLVTPLPHSANVSLPLSLSLRPASHNGVNCFFHSCYAPATSSDQFSFVSLLVRAASCLLPPPPTSGLLLPPKQPQPTSSDQPQPQTRLQTQPQSRFQLQITDPTSDLTFEFVFQ